MAFYSNIPQPDDYSVAINSPC